jgi:hypothetical protein
MANNYQTRAFPSTELENAATQAETKRNSYKERHVPMTAADKMALVAFLKTLTDETLAGRP